MEPVKPSKTEQSVVEENRAKIDIEDESERESENEQLEKVNEILLNKIVEYSINVFLRLPSDTLVTIKGINTISGVLPNKDSRQHTTIHNTQQV
jgi:hypothetical protein